MPSEETVETGTGDLRTIQTLLYFGSAVSSNCIATHTFYYVRKIDIYVL